jgi:hypothetical protein
LRPRRHGLGINPWGSIDWSADGRFLWFESGDVFATLLVTVWPASAHHGHQVVFDPSRTIALVSTLTDVDWRNPHIELSLETDRRWDRWCGSRSRTGRS